MNGQPTSEPSTRRNAKDIATGAFLIAVALAGLLLNLDYSLGSAAQMGSGYLPMLIFVIILILGAAIAIVGLRNGPDPLEPWAFRELAMVLAAMAVFGALLESAGLAISLALLVTISGLADRTQTVRGLLGLVIALEVICWGIFIEGLGLNLPFLPRALGWV